MIIPLFIEGKAMLKSFFYICLILAVFTNHNVANSTEVRMQSHSFHFPNSKTTETVEVFLPQDYLSSDKTYPVLFTTAGQNRLKMMIPMLDWLTHVDWSPIPQLIVVTVPTINEGVEMFKDDGASGKFDSATVKWLGKTLIPFVNNKYRTQPFRILEGFSSYGNFPLYVFQQHTEMFHSYICISPALVLNQHSLIDDFKTLKLKTKKPRSLFVSLGNFEQNKLLFQKLKANTKHLPERIDKTFKDHSQDFYLQPPITAMIDALIDIFSDRTPKIDTLKLLYENGGIQAIDDYFLKLKQKYGSDISSVSSIETLAFHFAKTNNQTAITLMKIIIKRMPDDVLYKMHLAEIYSDLSLNAQAKSTLLDAISQAKKQNDNEAVSYLQSKLSELK